MTLAMNLRVVRALAFKALNEIVRVPGAAIPGVIAPAIFLIGINGVFGQAAALFGANVDFTNWIIPVSLLQSAGFSGAATGVNLARDIEQGWFDRLLASPAPRPALLAGLVASAAVRSLIPAVVLLSVAFAIGAEWPGLDGLALAVVGLMGMGVAAACWGCALALRFRTQAAAPLMQAGMFILVLMTTSYAPAELLQDWLQTVAEVNPVTQVLEMARQGFVGEVTWSGTWPGLVALAVLIAILAAFALRGMHKMAD